MTKLQYRPELDGLRALAVVPVILYHAGLQSLSGGFLGVDVFFVISGYLITNILYSEMSLGKFTFLGFYERRARRILPTLFLVCLACIPAAYFLLMPSDLYEFAGSLVSVNLFASNFFFWSQTDYFASSSDLKPLLHTWSLAVEEQFYIFFPFLLLAMRKLPRKTVLYVILALSLGSFLFSVIGSRRFFDANFFLLPSRAWELGAGAAIALALGGRILSPSRLTQIGSWTGIIMVVGSYIFLDKTMLMPGLFSLFPVLGTVLIICCTGHTGTLSTRLMTLKPMIWIGLISYSAYLWHQPIFAFARHMSLFELSLTNMIFVIGLTLVLAWLTTKYVEAPFRNRKTFNFTKIVQVSSALCVLIIAIGIVEYSSHGMPDRKHGLAANIEQAFQKTEGLSPNCHMSPLPRDCIKAGSADRKTIAVWGDSFAMHLVDGVIASEPDVNLYQLTMHSCPPIRDATPFNPWGNGQKGANWTQQCQSFNNQASQFIADNPDIDTVVLSSQFAQIVRAEYFVSNDNQHITTSVETVEPKILDTIAWLKKAGKEVVIIGPMPNSDHNIGRCLAKSQWFGLSGKENCLLHTNELAKGELQIEGLLTDLAMHHRVLSLKNELCHDGVCDVMVANTPLYYDGGHLTTEGSRALGKALHFYDFILNDAREKRAG
ncbi:acyltransferase family protein [Hirschia baltica]|uniref:Acyltransferase 3 n=1 Tax=Hirschia baltica (strain ATCC 49814 / DSM 5838 / IFAM 1418) TaxID=582402 RepID=C6XRZ2_HIRBI|nr:acyltransferase family protein [Hirschia baltica]ACT60833.1 acyltransferase 3 [Hirschia baltica ATCC 49814]